MKADGGHSALVKQNRLQSTMVVAQVALALVVLVGAGLMVRTVYELEDQYQVCGSVRVLTLRTDLPLNKYDEPQKRVNFYDDVLARVRSLPDVSSPPTPRACRSNGKAARSGFYPEGKPVEHGLVYDANHRQVSPEYFDDDGYSGDGRPTVRRARQLRT